VVYEKVSTQNDVIGIVLANRNYLYTVLQRIFGNETQCRANGDYYESAYSRSFEALA
jgi:hypothetical protein